MKEKRDGYVLTINVRVPYKRLLRYGIPPLVVSIFGMEGRKRSGRIPGICFEVVDGRLCHSRMLTEKSRQEQVARLTASGLPAQALADIATAFAALLARQTPMRKNDPVDGTGDAALKGTPPDE